jgi:YHS domain-containing protein
MARFLIYLFDLIVLFLVTRLLSRVLKTLFGGTQVRFSSSGGTQAPRADRAEPALQGQTARDPLCGMFVSTELSHKLAQGAETLHFCSRECLERYQRESAKV